MRRPLILGSIHDYQWRDLSPFVLSLRGAGYAGEILFFYGQIEAETRAQLIQHGVTLRPLSQKAPTRHLTTRNRFWRCAPCLPPSARRALLQRLVSVKWLRYFEYLNFLRREGGQYSQVFLLDVRDVIFQADPFADLPAKGIYCFEESRRFTVGTEHYMQIWTRDLFGAEVLQAIAPEPVLCSGSILGDPASLQRFIGKLIQTMTRTRIIQNMGDQACMNVMVRGDKELGTQLCPNGGRVLTMGTLLPEEIRLNAAGQVVNESGQVIPVLHQYDRHPAVCEKVAVLKKWLPPTG